MTAAGIWNFNVRDAQDRKRSNITEIKYDVHCSSFLYVVLLQAFNCKGVTKNCLNLYVRDRNSYAQSTTQNKF